ncbi:MAG: discoidin domain-containing protein [Trueperaceae bacterium]|nr:discoidin domain-containing protein [Trueperaceae bacterium]
MPVSPFSPSTTRLAAVLASLMVALASVSALSTALAQDAPLPTVEPVEPFLSAPLAMAEVGPRSAVLEVTTTIDLACAVVFGPDDGFGGLALDQQMGAGAHQDHRVILTDLEPDTEYLFRLQGSAPDGRLLASEVQAFRTPPEQADERFGPRVEGLQALAASSTFASGFAAENAVDGDGGSEWSSRGDGDDAWLEIGLPGSTRLSGVGVWTRTMATSARIERFVIRTDDGATFGPFELPDANGLHRFEVDATTSAFRLEVVDSTGGNTGLVELEAYRAP